MPEPESLVTLASEGKRSAPGSLLGFFALTFAVAWSFFIAAAAWSQSRPPGAPLAPGLAALVLAGTFAPALVALGLTARAAGRAGVRALLRRLVAWQVQGRWYVFAAGYMATFKLATALLYRLVTGEWPRFGFDTWYLMVGATFLSTVIGGQAGEETGWRGYALPRLAARFGLGGAGVVLGVIWACWHLPLFYLRGADTYGQSFPAYLLQVTALSVAIAWLYWRTHGSLLLTMLMHAAVNNTKDIVPSAPRAIMNPLLPDASLMSWLATALLWIAAAYFLVRMRGAKSAGALRKTWPGSGASI